MTNNERTAWRVSQIHIKGFAELTEREFLWMISEIHYLNNQKRTMEIISDNWMNLYNLAKHDYEQLKKRMKDGRTDIQGSDNPT